MKDKGAFLYQIRILIARKVFFGISSMSPTQLASMLR